MMKKAFEIVFLFIVFFFSHQKLANSVTHYNYNFTATVTQSYYRYADSTGEYRTGEIGRWKIGDHLHGDFYYNNIDHNGDGIGGEESYLHFSGLDMTWGSVSVTNDLIDTYTLRAGDEFGRSTAWIEIIDPTGTMLSNYFDDIIPGPLNLTNSALFDVTIGFISIYDGPADYSYYAEMSAVGHIEPIPLPSAMFLYGSGLVGLVAVARCKLKT
jgi:hypothetical protein